MGSYIYVIGSLRSKRPAQVANELRAQEFDIFDDWAASHFEADDAWQAYEKARGHNYREALLGKAAINAFEFDYRHLCSCKGAVLVRPCGASAHLELGLILGQGKPGFILLDGEPERYELMVKAATAVCYDIEELVAAMKKAGL